MPERAAFSAEYLASHQLLEKTARIVRPSDERASQRARPLLVWKGGKQFVPVTGRIVN